MSAHGTVPAPFRRRGYRSVGLAAVLLVLIAALWSLSPRAALAEPQIVEVAHTMTGRAGPANLTIEVTGVRSAKGAVRVAVCTAPTFLKDACPYSASVPATPGSTLVSVAGVPPGVYAVQLFHDENDNQMVDRGLFGIPTEAIGFSNDAPVGLKGPRFASAAFVHGVASQKITVTLRRIVGGG